jgi:hypothetical protein
MARGVEGLGGGGASGFGMGVRVFHRALVRFGNRWVGPDLTGRKLCYFVAFCRVFRLYTQQNNLCRVFFSKTHGKLRPIFRSFYIFNFMYLIITSLKFGLYKAYFFTIFSFFISLLCLYYINPSEMLCGAGKPARSRYTFRQNQHPFGYDA